MIELGLKVLIVDPMATTTRSVADQFREVGFRQVDQVHNGQSAQEYLVRDDYGLVLAEWELGRVSGLDLLKSVRSNPRTKNLPFMLMTAEVDVDRVIAARQAGVSGYLVKPFSEKLLKQKLIALIPSL